ncbi:MAG: hypothetical protein KJ574_02920, partial [Nanoarchaeota archaeon]|nr:hypothetical protein [Nanoarchaeota archaeon]
AVANAETDITPVSFTVKATPVVDKILETGAAEFTLTITNLQDVPDTFRVLPLEDLKWTPQFVPVIDKVKIIPGKSSATIKVLVKPSNVPRGTHNVRVTVESANTKTRYNDVMKIWVGPHPSMYSPDIAVSVNAPERLDPNQKYDIKISLTNNNIIDLGNVHVITTGDFINHEQDIYLGPEEQKVISVAFNLPQNVNPQAGNARVKVTHGNKTFYEQTHEFDVLEYLPPFVQNVSIKKSFLKTEKMIVLKNDGNTRKESPVKLETTRRLQLFTSTNPKAEISEEDGKRYYVWNVALESGEATMITVATSYRWLLVIIILIIIGYVLYLLFKSPIVAVKQFKDVTYDDGSIAEATILIHVKNRSSKPVKNVEIIERVPHVVGIKKGSFKHTLEPKKAYKHGKEGIVLEYDLPHLDPHEERMITYTIKSKIHIIGSMTLKPTIVKFKSATGQQEKVFSAELIVPGTE